MRDEERGERLARPGRREEERRLAPRDRRPAERLRARRLAERRAKPRRDRGDEEAERRCGHDCLASCVLPRRRARGTRSPPRRTHPVDVDRRPLEGAPRVAAGARVFHRGRAVGRRARRRTRARAVAVAAGEAPRPFERERLDTQDVSVAGAELEPVRRGAQRRLWIVGAAAGDRQARPEGVVERGGEGRRSMGAIASFQRQMPANASARGPGDGGVSWKRRARPRRAAPGPRRFGPRRVATSAQSVEHDGPLPARVRREEVERSFEAGARGVDVLLLARATARARGRRGVARWPSKRRSPAPGAGPPIHVTLSATSVTGSAAHGSSGASGASARPARRPRPAPSSTRRRSRAASAKFRLRWRRRAATRSGSDAGERPRGTSRR